MLKQLLQVERQLAILHEQSSYYPLYMLWHIVAYEWFVASLDTIRFWCVYRRLFGLACDEPLKYDITKMITFLGSTCTVALCMLWFQVYFLSRLIIILCLSFRLIVRKNGQIKPWIVPFSAFLSSLSVLNILTTFFSLDLIRSFIIVHHIFTYDSLKT